MLEAEIQGYNRFKRGKNAYYAARTIARKEGWPFNWKLVIARGVAHKHEQMFDHAKSAEALEWKVLER